MRPTNKYERVVLKRTKTKAPRERAPLFGKWLQRKSTDTVDNSLRFAYLHDQEEVTNADR